MLYHPAKLALFLLTGKFSSRKNVLSYAIRFVKIGAKT